MDEVLRFIELEAGRGVALSLWEALFAFLVALLASLCIAITYRLTHRTPGYSQSFVHTLVLITLITAFIMVVIGSNLARAFSLIGAMSIIRFRNAVKETRDVGFLFLAIAAGMGAGTRFYSMTLIAVGLMCFVMLMLERFDFARPIERPEGLLRIQLPPDSDLEKLLGPILEKLFESHSLVSLETAKKGLVMEALYSVQPRPEVTAPEILKEVGTVNEGLKVHYHHGAHTDPL
ncbi:MAG: DUF4956 domain-containing protein [Candidatus Eremiobacteraeota bacterium]|nr:DUF4956 domain-containing protein [Candidatus Eremiobacteraeota bacterium]